MTNELKYRKLSKIKIYVFKKIFLLVLIEPKESKLKKEIILDKEIFKFGRHEENEICLNFNFISRYHLQLIHDFKSNNTYIMDLNSSNGTFLNEEKIKNCQQLKNEDLISFSSCSNSNDKNIVYKFLEKKEDT